ncbi:MAG TPA: UpxY family transcription antiterminator [Thermodesulfobacteriota bacterium]|nr:UpxY family transcription antiterminator [Thermodesulfobacteriota bacterium]
MPENTIQNAAPGENGGNSAAASEERNWYAVHTRSRHEKRAAWDLDERNVEAFLPLRETLCKWKDRKKRIQMPLFPGYLFVRIDPRDSLDVLGAKGVVRILGSSGVPVPVPEEEIDAARKLVRSGIPCAPFPYDFEGREAVITGGPLEGLRGRIESQRGGFRLILSVHLIRSAVSVEVGAGDVELL